MDGQGYNKDAMAPRLGLNPDDPIPSIERSNSRSSEDSVTTTLPTRERTQARGGLIGSQHHYTSNTHRIPRQLPIERRGSHASYAENLRDFLGPINPPRQLPQDVQQAVRRVSPRTAQYHASLSPYLGPLNPRRVQQLAGDRVSARVSSNRQLTDPRHQTTGSNDMQPTDRAPIVRPMSNHIRALGSDRFQGLVQPRSTRHSSSYPIPYQTATSRRRSTTQRSFARPLDTQQQPSSNAMRTFHSDSTQVPGRNFNHSGPVPNNPQTLALDPQNSSSHSFQAPQELQRRVMSQSDSSTSHQRSQIQETGSYQHSIPTPDNAAAVGIDTLTTAPEWVVTAAGSVGAIQGTFGVLIPQSSIKQGRPAGSTTNSTHTRRAQPPPKREVLPGPSKTTTVLSPAVPIPLSQQPNTVRPSQEVTFSIARNASLMLNPYSKIVPGSIKLVADNEQVWEYKYPGTRRNWKKGANGKVTVTKLNEWANNILRRRLPDNFPAATRKRSSSAPPKPKFEKWTEWERAYLEAQIMDAIKAKKAYLDKEDWQLVTDTQNEEFLDHKRLPGLPLAQLTSRMLTIDDVPVMRGGGFIKTEGYFPERSSSEIQRILYSWPEIQEKMKDEVKKYRGKIPAYLDCDTDLSDSELSSDGENESKDTIVVDSGGNEA